MYIAALLTGFLGSFHCLGMCGPIALALNGGQGVRWQAILERLLYNFGRAFTYALLGAIVGFLGQSLVWVVGYQVYISWVLGVFLILAGIFAIDPDRLLVKIPGMHSWLQQLRQMLGKYLNKGGKSTFFTLGVINGLLPCGLVYMGLAGALATGSLPDGMLYMFIFGLGTMPALLFVSFAGKFINKHLRGKMRKLYPVMFVALGLFIIFRASNISLETDRNTGNSTAVCK